MGHILFKILFVFVLSGRAWGSLEAPPLYYMSFKEVGYPSYLTKLETKWSLQTIMDSLYGIGFVDMGDISDLMHGHVILASKGGKRHPVAVLYHSQEYDFFRKGQPYIGPYGEIDSYDRNWVLFLQDRGRYKRGDVIDANHLLTKPKKEKIYTIRVSDLDKNLMGSDMIEGESYYFFRTFCENFKEVITKVKFDNVLEINNPIKKEKICLVMVSFNCRNHPQKQECQSQFSLQQYRDQLIN